MPHCPERAVLSVLDNGGPMAVTSLAQSLDEHPTTVDLTCAELQSSGHVKQISGGIYDITADGTAYLSAPVEHG